MLTTIGARPTVTYYIKSDIPLLMASLGNCLVCSIQKVTGVHKALQNDGHSVTLILNCFTERNQELG